MSTKTRGFKSHSRRLSRVFIRRFYQYKKQNNIVKSLQESVTGANLIIQNKEREETEKAIRLICKHQKQFIITSLKKLLDNSIENTKIICNYIIAEQNEINIKESTKEGKIKVLVDFVNFTNYKNLEKITKVDVLSYLNKFRKDNNYKSQDQNVSIRGQL